MQCVAWWCPHEQQSVCRGGGGLCLCMLCMSVYAKVYARLSLCQCLCLCMCCDRVTISLTLIVAQKGCVREYPVSSTCLREVKVVRCSRQLQGDHTGSRRLYPQPNGLPILLVHVNTRTELVNGQLLQPVMRSVRSYQFKCTTITN